MFSIDVCMRMCMCCAFACACVAVCACREGAGVSTYPLEVPSSSYQLGEMQRRISVLSTHTAFHALYEPASLHSVHACVKSAWHMPWHALRR